MMKFSEMSNTRKAATIVGDVLFFGALILGHVIPTIPVAAILGAEIAGLAISLFAYFTAKKTA